MAVMAFGPRAQEVERRLPPLDTDVIVADPEGAHHALIEAYSRRVRGRSFAAMILLEEETTELGRQVSEHIITRVQERHERLRSLGAFTVDRLRIDGKPPREAFDRQGEQKVALLNLLWLAGHVLARSQHERRLLFGFCGQRTLTIRVITLEDVRVPFPRNAGGAPPSASRPDARGGHPPSASPQGARGGDYSFALGRAQDVEEIVGPGGCIVVWAPDRVAAELGPLCLSLEDLRYPAVLVTRDGSAAPFSLTACTPAEAARVLQRARLLIDTSTDAPDAAHALARWGLPLMVSHHLVGEPTLDGVVGYQTENHVVIATAIRCALATGTLVAPPPLTAAEPPRPERCPHVELREPGRVSFIVPTCNRPAYLRRALQSIEAQTWPAVEALVVNDGQDDVTEVVAAFSRARLVPNPTPGRGPSAARNRALDVASGAYVGFLDDDDLMFPDHAERMVGALDRSGADWVQSDLMACYARWADDGRCMIEAIEVYPTRQDLRQLQFTCLFVLPSLLFRRSLLATERFDEGLFVCEDYDLWVRLAARSTPCYQPVPTTRFIVWDNGTNNSNLRGNQFHDAYATLYARYPTDDPVVEAQRRKELARLAEVGRVTPPRPTLGRYLVGTDMAWLEALERQG